jgi:hypothetical protein
MPDSWPIAERRHQERVSEMRIDFFFWADCPSHEQALERLREVMAEERLTAPIGITEVRDEQQAVELRFLGSPTIRIDGVDVDPTADQYDQYNLTCRIYTRPDGRITPLPPREMLQAALRRTRPLVSQ